MRAKEFKKLVKEYSPQTILTKYMKLEIYLNDRQLDQVIQMKEGTEEEGRGGISFGKDLRIIQR